MLTIPSPTLVGVDIAARTLAVAIAHGEALPTPAETLTNDPDGWRALLTVLTAHGSTPAETLVIMEATGSYWQGLAMALHTAGWGISVVPPASVRDHARARFRRAKTDALDAALLVDYARRQQPARWSPPPPEIAALRLLLRQRDDLVAMRTQTRNRQHALAQWPTVPVEAQQPLVALARVLAEQIAARDAAIKQRAAATVTLATEMARLQTITGVGMLTAAVVLTETRPLRGNVTPRQVVAFAGLDPAPHESGTSVRGARHMSKTGNARLRQAVYMAALAASRYNPVLRTFYQRLRAHGKKPRVALVAVARKLLALMVTLLIHERDFDPDWATHRHAT
ncbi:MAG: IS110 family transposase [Chloroflexota bacterium]|nr:IS110 family transposase [Chloroflexota bacterium]